MDYEPADFRKLVVKQYPPRALRETPEGRYWRRFKTPVLAQQVALTDSELSRRAVPERIDQFVTVRSRVAVGG